MIRINCHSNEDNLRLTNWPDKLDVRPIIGEYISSIDGRHSRKIVRIEHVVFSNKESKIVSYMQLELSK